MQRFVLTLVLAMSTTAGTTTRRRSRQGARPRGPLPLARGRDGRQVARVGAGPERRERQGARDAGRGGAREAHPRHPRLQGAHPHRPEARPLVLQPLEGREEPARAVAPHDARGVPQARARLGDRDRRRRARRGREGELGLARGRLPEARLQALYRPALARRRRRRRGARVRPRGQGLPEGRLLAARVEEQRRLAGPRPPLRGHRLRRRLADDLRLPADRQGLEAGHAARGGRDASSRDSRETSRSPPSATTPAATSATSCCARRRSSRTSSICAATASC